MTELRRYGRWAGDPDGTLEDVTKCIQSIMGSNRWDMGHQCGRKRGYGPEGLYCTQHGKQAQEQLDREAARAAEQAKTPEQKAAEREAMRQIEIAYRREHFKAEFVASVYREDEWALSVTTNGSQWQTLHLLPEEWRQVMLLIHTQFGAKE